MSFSQTPVVTGLQFGFKDGGQVIVPGVFGAHWFSLFEHTWLIYCNLLKLGNYDKELVKGHNNRSELKNVERRFIRA